MLTVFVPAGAVLIGPCLASKTVGSFDQGYMHASLQKAQSCGHTSETTPNNGYRSVH